MQAKPTLRFTTANLPCDPSALPSHSIAFMRAVPCTQQETDVQVSISILTTKIRKSAHHIRLREELPKISPSYPQNHHRDAIQICDPFATDILEREMDKENRNNDGCLSAANIRKTRMKQVTPSIGSKSRSSR